MQRKCQKLHDAAIIINSPNNLSIPGLGTCTRLRILLLHPAVTCVSLLSSLLSLTPYKHRVTRSPAREPAFRSDPEPEASR
jgi:hypothetical protein